MSARLIAIAGPLEGKSIELGPGALTIGRHLSSGLCLSDALVSRHHCEIDSEGGRYRLRDCGSQNGTLVNGQPVHEHWLEDGDEVTVGGSQFRVALAAAKEAEGEESKTWDDRTVGRTTVILRPEESPYLEPGRLLAERNRERVARNLRALLEVATTIHRERSLASLAARLLETIMSLAPAERGAIVLVDPDSGALEVVCARDSQGNTAPFRISRHIVSEALGSGAGLLVEDVTEPGAVELTQTVVSARVRSVLAVPLAVMDRDLGVIYLDSGRPKDFERDHLETLTAIAASASIAMDNARHMQWLEGELRREESLRSNLIGRSQAMERVERLIARVAATESTVLIAGESGTGKELAARAIHTNSPRAERAFIAVNCATFSPTLLESELFGHERGAFTGAVARKPGKLEAARGGTLFLDEIGEMDVGLQARLLRVLANREYQMLGSNQTLTADVRVIAATNRDLKQAIAQGQFREDLFFRLNVFPIRMPSLRDRREDIPLLAEAFLERACARMGRPLLAVSPEAQRLLLAYDWPGNVRELENAIERAVVLCSGKTILPEDLPEALLEQEPEGESGALPDYHEAVNRFKKDLVLRTLEQTGGNYTEAARLLGLHPNNLHRLIRNLGLRETLKASS